MNRRTRTYISSPARRRLPKKRRKASGIWPKAKKFFTTYKTLLLIAIIVGLIVTIAKLMFAYTIGKPENTIQEIIFSDESVQQYDDKDMYAFMRETLSDENIILLKIHQWWDPKQAIMNAYPFIKDFTIEKLAANKILVDVSFYSADLVFINDRVQIAYVHKYLIPIRSGDQISSGAIQIVLPEYFSGDEVGNNASSYISLIGLEKFKEDAQEIYTTLLPTQFLFLIGSQKSTIQAWSKTITFDHKRNIHEQIRYLQTIQWLDKDTPYDIDLTSYPKVIIKKKE